LVTIEKELVNVYKLHFDDGANQHYQIVLSRNIDTVRYYAKKLMRTKGWFLEDFYELTIYDDHLRLTQYVLDYRADVNGKVRQRIYRVADTNRHFNQIL
jgi:hypothetical protein